jgi:hypothetical protein
MKSKKNKAGNQRGSITGQVYITHEHELIATLAAIVHTEKCWNPARSVGVARAILQSATGQDVREIEVDAQGKVISRPEESQP